MVDACNKEFSIMLPLYSQQQSNMQDQNDATAMLAFK